MYPSSSLITAVRPSTLLLPLGVWVVMAVLAVANGVVRETFVIPRTGEYPGHVLSTLVLVSLILLVSWLFFEWTSVEYTLAERLVIGGGWTLFTVGFEFLVGWAEGTPVSVTIGQYDVFAGQVWILVPTALFLAPLVFG